MSETFKKLDHQVYRAERAIVVVSLVLMAVVVFLDVVHRTFSGEGSKLAAAMAKVAGMFGSEVPEDSEGFAKLAAVAPWISVVVAFGLGYLGVRTTKRAEPVPPARAALYAAFGLAVVYGLIRLLLVVLPNGLVWSQPLALVLTLWVGFVGASMCTYEGKHLKVEAVKRFLPPSIKPIVAFVSALVTAAVCAALAWVSLRYVLFNYEVYANSEGKGGMFPGMDVPMYLGFIALPVSFVFMTVRFSARGIAALRGELPEDDPTGGLLDALPRESSADDGLRPSDVETEAMPAEALRPSDIDTVSSRNDRDDSRPSPSRINTQPHETVDRAEAQAPAAGTLGTRRADLAQDDEPDEFDDEPDHPPDPPTPPEPDLPPVEAGEATEGAETETEAPTADAADSKTRSRFAPPAPSAADDSEEGDR